MNTLLTKIAIIASALCFSLNARAHVVIDYPKGGETLTSGSMVTIQWHIAIPHNTLNWDLYFSSNGGTTWQAIQLDLPAGDLSYAWQVPATAGTQSRVKVIQDNSDQDYEDQSMNFTIQTTALPPSINVAASDINIECNFNSQGSAIQAWLSNHGGASVANFCGDLVWTNDFTSLSNDCGATGSAVVHFTATDACGSTVTSAVLAVVDTEPPVVTVPANNMVFQCGSNTSQINTWLNTRGGAFASDACGGVTWTNNFPVLTDTCGSSLNIPVTFTAHDQCGNISMTNAMLKIVATSATSFPDFSDLEIKMYPNPVSDMLHIDLDKTESSDIQLMLFDACGKLLASYQKSSNEISLPVDSYSPGIYFLQVKTSKGACSRKVIIE